MMTVTRVHGLDELILQIDQSLQCVLKGNGKDFP